MFSRNYKNCYCMNKDYDNVEACKEKNNDSNVFDNSCDYCQNSCELINDCQCGFDELDNGFPNNPVLGQAYTPIQRMKDVFKPYIGLQMGTIFPELVSPYIPCQSKQEIKYLEMANEVKGGCNTCR